MFASLRSRLWLTYTLVIGVVLAIVALALVIYLVRNPLLSREAAAKLRIASTALQSDRFTIGSLDRLEVAAQRIDETYDVRVVVLSPDGVVLIDSRDDAAIPTLPSALPGGDLQPVRTFQDQDGQTWLYTMQPLQNRRRLIVATPRPRVPIRSILTDDLFTPLMQAGAIALLLSLLLAFLISRWVAAPLQRMASAARAVSSGEHQPLALEGPSEVQSLGRAFNEMTVQLKASQQSQRDFVANVSHELKTPLTSVQGFAQAILDGTANNPETLQKSAQVIYDEAGRMHRLVIDLLDLARLDAGTADLQRAPLELELLLRGLADKFAPQSRQAQVTLRTEIEHLPGFIGDGDRLAQVFTNLVDNALKHTPPGGQVTIKARQVSDQVEVSIADTGQGIPPDELSRIFERFYQLDKSRRGGETERRVGLGLAIARQIVSAHKGRIEARSKVGRGSVFIVHLPVAQPDDVTLALERSRLRGA